MTQKLELFAGGSPLDWVPDEASCSVDQITNWLFYCSLWNNSEADGIIRPDLPSQAVGDEPNEWDFKLSLFGPGNYRVLAPNAEQEAFNARRRISGDQRQAARLGQNDEPNEAQDALYEERMARRLAGAGVNIPDLDPTNKLDPTQGLRLLIKKVGDIAG